MRFVEENGKYAAIADPGMAISFPGGYCHKLYRKTNDFTDCTEIPAPVVDEELTDTEALAIIMGGAT